MTHHAHARSTTRRVAGLLATVALLATSACSAVGSGGESDESATDGSKPTKVVLVTHESFALPDELVSKFEEESGYELVVRAAGDAGTLSAKLSLTQGNPTGDAAFGIDNTFASRTLDEGVFDTYEPTLPQGAEAYALPEGSDRLAPIDVGHVCVNVDKTWFADKDLAPPVTLEDLTKPAYQDLFVTPGASTSSPGMAFLLSTIAEYGDEWPAYWERLLGNGAEIVDGWSDAYYTDFTQGGEHGTRPIVLSYDSSPAFTVPKGEKMSTTAALLDTCFRSVEYAGVLAGAKNPDGAEALVDFLLSDEVQAALPETMYVFPVSSTVELPKDWAAFAEQPTAPYDIDPAEISANREKWLTEWTDVTTR
ncbi:thiamine ABC transporter substrate-binding protein [Nocardioides sp. LHG3406-4]|uniref:thiamine ABC transporter substrate-binding protein n=1 Tax=Nocardioides sp. LHG3406-4 TaxID=2804575 RepID=UPI003CF05D85